MDLNLTFTAAQLKGADLTGKTAVIIDILRASSTIITALANHCQKIIPVLDIEEAKALACSFPPGTVLLGGERNAQLIPGFDMGNSPQTYNDPKISGKTIIFSSTNGTKAIINATEAKADEIIIASFLNAAAAARQIASIDKDCVIVCSGSYGKFSMEDMLGAGALITELKNLDVKPLLSDSANAAYRLYQSYDSPLQGIMDSQHALKLEKLGLSEDLEYCSRLNLFDTAALLRGKTVIKPCPPCDQ